jgi:hypothetical protein
MKKILSFIGTNLCYYIGSFFGYFMNFTYLDFLYTPYKRFMTWSFEIQDWGGLKYPWIESTKNSEKTLPEEEKEFN